mmetsp:Transcript_114024/g.179499  ORF Transcript_114024/g.179499 Transcript_114024/m.179499 type:complete len:89 (-) Transcript_114024:159-425(-)
MCQWKVKTSQSRKFLHEAFCRYHPFASFAIASDGVASLCLACVGATGYGLDTSTILQMRGQICQSTQLNARRDLALMVQCAPFEGCRL